MRASRGTRPRGRAYVPALGHDVLTRLYDPLVRATMPEERFCSRLVLVQALAGALPFADGAFHRVLSSLFSTT